MILFNPMRKILKLILNKNSVPLFVVLVFGILAARSLIFQPGYFIMHDDLQMMRQLQMEKCFLDGQIPCRWVPDMGYGYGFPLFNFYPPLPYLIGQGIRIIGFSFVTTAKLGFALSLIASGAAMYFLAKEFFGRAGGVLSAIFYIWAPYHAVEVYVRGAMNENWAMVFFPLIFLFSYKLVRADNNNIIKWLVALSLSWFGLLTSHNLMVMILAPFFGVWLILLFLLYKLKRLPYLIISGIWALGLASYFTIPALMEYELTQLKNQLVGYYEYSAHFVTIRQLLVSRFWGYEGSAWGTENDGMSFSIGHLHWILSVFIGMAILIRVFLVKIKGWQNKNVLSELRKHPVLMVLGLFFIIGWIAAFMTHERSTPIYLFIPQLQYIQFPWRFLTVVIFAFSFLVGVVPKVFAGLKEIKTPVVGFILKIAGSVSQFAVVLFLAAILTLMNWSYFRPEGGKMGPLTDEEKFAGLAWELQQASGALDYLPIWAKRIPTEFRSEIADVIEGEAVISDASQGSYWSLFRINAEEDVEVRINTMYFPEWRVFIKENSNSTEIPTYVPEEEEWGRMWVELPPGEHLVYAQIFNTPVRTWSNAVSFVSWTIMLLLLLRKKLTPKPLRAL